MNTGRVRQWHVVAITALGLLFSVPAGAMDVSAPNGDEVLARDIVNQRCYSCHGRTGLSTTTQFPKLAGQNVEYLVKQMFNFQSKARPSVVMEEQMAGLSGNEIEVLARYFSRQEIRLDGGVDPKLAARGRKLFMEGNSKTGVAACMSCHGPRARGGQMLPRLAGQHAAYIERQLHAFIARSRANDSATMHMVARNLTDGEIKAVANFLSGLD